MLLDRIKAITDGVLAIVLTILVLSFEVPEHEFSESGVLGFLAKLRVPFLAYVVSFGVVAAYWMQHAAIFRLMREGNRPLVWMNMLFMLPLTLLPFFTDMRVEYHDEYRVTALYAGANVVSGLVLLGMWRYAVRKRLTALLPSTVDRSMSRRIMLGIVINLIGAAVAPISTQLSSLAFLTLPLLYLSHAAIDDVPEEASESGTAG
jgi:TMEM175 potassium channel family protein